MRLRSVGRTRLLCFDLESRPSAFWFDGATTAEITAFGWKWADEKKVRTLLLQADGSFLDDLGERVHGDVAYTRFRAELASAGLVYGHNIRQFDLPMLNGGLLRRELPTLPRLLTTDTLKDYPRRKDMSASLENLAKVHGVSRSLGAKKHMSVFDWEQANRLTSDGVREARERVASDVLLQEGLRARLLERGLLAAPRMWG
jgi:hypothetical protein